MDYEKGYSNRRSRGGYDNRTSVTANSGISGKLGRRLFIVGHRDISEEEYREAFTPYGTIDDIYIVHKAGKSRSESKGIVYITMSKISEAALAIEELNGKQIGDCQKFIKVMVASEKKGEAVNDADEDAKYHRLFIMMKPDDDEESIQTEFGKYGKVLDVTVLKNKRLCFVKFARRYCAALALENADREYKAVFATPKNSMRRPPPETKEPMYEDNYRAGGKRSRYEPDSYGADRHRYVEPTPSYNPVLFNSQSVSSYNVPIVAQMASALSSASCSVHVTASPYLSEDNLRRLFDIIPGMYSVKFSPSSGTGLVHYSTPQYATYAVEKLDGFEYPTGHCLIVRLSDPSIDSNESFPDSLSHAAEVLQRAGIDPSKVLATDAMDTSHGGELEHVPYCDFEVPKRQCLRSSKTEMAKRLFIVCQPNEISQAILKDLFCRFGELIDLTMVPNRNIGYAKFACIDNANAARDWLHLKFVAKCRLKVIDAEDKPDRHAIRSSSKISAGMYTPYEGEDRLSRNYEYYSAQSDLDPKVMVM